MTPPMDGATTPPDAPTPCRCWSTPLEDCGCTCHRFTDDHEGHR